MKYLSTFSQSLVQAVDYYTAIDKKLALRFFESVEHAKREIIRFHKSGKLANGYRSLLLKNFPYKFCYRENMEGELVGVVLFHLKQRESPATMKR